MEIFKQVLLLFFFSKAGLIKRGLQIEILKLERTLIKGQSQIIEVKVTNDKGLAVKNATVNTELFNGSIIDLIETDLGIYIGSFIVRETDFSGRTSITISAKKTIGDNEFEAKLIENVIVQELFLEFEITGLDKSTYTIGNLIEIKIAGRVNQQPVPLKEVEIFLGEKKIDVKKEQGVFSATIVFDETHSPFTELTIKATDLYQNTGSRSIPISVSGYFLPYYIQKDPPIFFILVMIVLVEVLGVTYVIGKKSQYKRLKKRKAELLIELKNLQKKYFQEGFLSRKDYDSSLLKLETELKNINKKI